MKRIGILLLFSFLQGLYADDIKVPDLNNQLKNTTPVPLRVTIEGEQVTPPDETSPIKINFIISPGQIVEYLATGCFLKYNPEKNPILIQAKGLKVEIPESGCYDIYIEKNPKTGKMELKYRQLMASGS